MNNISYIESKGFRVKGTYIYKASKLTKVIGKLNDKNFYFFSENVYPFKQGVNYFDNSTLTDGKIYKQYIQKAKENERSDFDVNFEQYIEVTKDSSIFGTYLNDTTRKWINKNSRNYFDIRGVRDGYLEDAICFPFFDYDGNFKTAQIIRYRDNGKRVKEGFNTNWFHSYKPIKRDLGLKYSDKYSVKIDCFFGENYLKDSNNIVGVVEAPKTAVILKEFYPNIDWIATAGQSNLRSKNLGLLEDRNVILFPDAQSTMWQEIANEYGWNVCKVLDKYNADEGSDIADYLFDSSFDGYSELHEFLFAINEGDFSADFDASLLDFQFKRIADEHFYFTAVPNFYKGEQVLLKVDNSKIDDIIFKGKQFDIYSKKYKVLNAQIDWHKQDTLDENKVLVGFNEDRFKFHLQKCFRILKELNPNNYLGIFDKTLISLKRDSNFSFNSKYVKNVLVPMWDNWNDDLSRFYKERNWKYKGTDQITRNEFSTFLNDEKFRCKLSLRLKSFKDAIQENRFIHYETDLGLSSYSSSRGYSQIMDLIKQWNSDVIGAKTYKSWISKVDFFEKMNSCTKSLPPYINNTYIVAQKMYNNISILKMSEITGVKNRDTIKRYLTFQPNRDTESLVKNQVNFLLENVQDIQPLRLSANGNTRLCGFKHIEPINEQVFFYENKKEWTDSFAVPNVSRSKDSESKALLRYSLIRLHNEDMPVSVKNSIATQLKIMLDVIDMKEKSDNKFLKPILNLDEYYNKEKSEMSKELIEKIKPYKEVFDDVVNF